MPKLCSCPLCSGLSLNTLDGSAPDTTLAASLVRTVNPAAPANTVITNVISGDSRIDALLLSASDRLNSSFAFGTPVVVSYSFPTQLPTAYTGNNALGWKPFSAQQQSAAREVLGLLQKQINITFVEVNDSPSAGGTIRFSDNTQSGSAGYAYQANSSGTSLSSDIFISNNYSTNVTPGSYAWTTMVHELGHALGLKHPGNYNATQTTNASAVGNFLGVNEDTFYNTIMSYRDSAQGIHDAWFMPYDLLALRYLYGTRAFETGNNTYAYTDAVGQSVSTVIDDGGTNTLDFSALTIGANINLTPGSYSSVGKLKSGAQALANLTISLGTVIQNVLGTKFGDVIVGNNAGDTFTGGGGSDTVIGGTGIDTVVFSGPRARDVVIKTPSGQTVVDSTGTDGTDTLTAIERLRFSDGKLALDLDAEGHAGQTVKLIGAVFGKAAITSTAYVAAGLRLLDGGMRYEDLATAAVNETGKSKSSDVVALLWTNLFDVAPTASQSAPYVAMLDKGMSTGALAVMAAETSENLIHIDLVGLAQTGVVYI